MTFAECIQECAKNDELVAQYHRLTGTRPPPTPVAEGKPLTKKQKEYAVKFASFVYKCVWSRLALVDV